MSGMQIEATLEHPDIEHARLTGYARADYTPPRPVWKATEIRHEDAFPYVIDEREDD